MDSQRFWRETHKEVSGPDETTQASRSSFLPLAARPLLPSMLLPFSSLQQGSGSRQFVCAIGSECPGQGSNWVFLDVSAATKETGHYGPSEFLTLVELMSE